MSNSKMEEVIKNALDQYIIDREYTWAERYDDSGAWNIDGEIHTLGMAEEVIEALEKEGLL